jgi:hypothetical protein
LNGATNDRVVKLGPTRRGESQETSEITQSSRGPVVSFTVESKTIESENDLQRTRDR